MFKKIYVVLCWHPIQKQIFIHTSGCTVRVGTVMNGIIELTLRMQLWVDKLSVGGQRKQSQSSPLDFSITNTGAAHQPLFYLKNKSEFHFISWCLSTNKSHFLKKKIKSNYLDSKHRINVPHSTWLKPVLKSRQAYAELTLCRTVINGRNALFCSSPNTWIWTHVLGCPWPLQSCALIKIRFL